MNLFEKNKFKYVNNMLSLDMVDYLSSWSLKNFKINNDPQAPMSSSIHSSTNVLSSSSSSSSSTTWSSPPVFMNSLMVAM